jgi:hypothetical protein
MEPSGRSLLGRDPGPAGRGMVPAVASIRVGGRIDAMPPGSGV